jgi:hypothetical protein
MKQVLPIAGSLYAARLISGKLAGRIPGLGAIPENMRSPALAVGLLVAGHFGTKKVKALRKHRYPIMIGLGLNAIDKLLSAFAPASVKEMVGVGEYVQIGDYYPAPPLQDNITLAEYVAVDDYVQIGDMEQDLGMEMDLGLLEAGMGDDFADRHLGGVSRSSMTAPIGRMDYRAPVPARSFTKAVPHITDNFDNPDRLYTGIFGGGFGS